jgi:hypothetical protein
MGGELFREIQFLVVVAATPGRVLFLLWVHKCACAGIYTETSRTASSSDLKSEA